MCVRIKTIHFKPHSVMAVCWSLCPAQTGSKQGKHYGKDHPLFTLMLTPRYKFSNHPKDAYFHSMEESHSHGDKGRTCKLHKAFLLCQSYPKVLISYAQNDRLWLLCRFKFEAAVSFLMSNRVVPDESFSGLIKQKEMKDSTRWTICGAERSHHTVGLFTQQACTCASYVQPR